MQTTYRYSYAGSGRVSRVTVDPDYRAEPGEHLSSPEPATDAQLEAWFPGCALSALKEALTSAASGSCGLVTRQIAESQAQLIGFQNAATMVDAAGKPPGEGDSANAFAALAASYGMTVAKLAGLVSGVRSVSVRLSALLGGVNVAAAKATKASDLAAALATFETGLTALVAALNGAGLAAPITAPAPIVISGVNG